MNYTRLLSRLSLLSLLVLSACAAAPAPLPPDAFEGMQPLEQGELIYSGDVFVEGAPPMFRYARRVDHRQEADVWTSTHITRHASTGALAVVQRARHTPQYTLQSFEEIHAQTGVVSSVEVLTNGGLMFQNTDSGEFERVYEECDGEDVVVGPTLFGYILTHWDRLLAGQALDIRFAVVDRAASYVFTLRQVESAAPGEVTVMMEAKGFMVRLATAPMYVTFDAERQVTRYEGAVPPRGARLEALEARVEYAFVSARYR